MTDLSNVPNGQFVIDNSKLATTIAPLIKNEIVVTGRKRDENVQNVPSALSV